MWTLISPRVLIKSLAAIGGISSIITHKINNGLLDVNAADAKPHYELEKTTKWDFKWDHHKRPTVGTEPRKPTAKRNILLIRHGKYHKQSGLLRSSGALQAKLTGEKLAQMNHQYHRQMISSTMQRAIETLIAIKFENFHLDIDFKDDLCEGIPIYPEPPSKSVDSLSPHKHICEDGRRLERAFKTYFYRAFPLQTDSYEVIVCHANVIKYFICRALQLPPEAWMRFSINHGSITWIVIHPDGRVQLKYAGDSAFMPKKLQTE